MRQNIDKEIIIINDGSSDETLNIAQYYAKQYDFIRIIHNRLNRGVSFARNLGLDNAQGEFVMFVDADDFLDLELDLSLIYIRAKKHQSPINKGLLKWWTNDRLKGCSSVYSEVSNGYEVIVQSSIAFACHSTEMGFLRLATMMIERELLLKHRLYFDENFIYGEDTLFLLRLFATNVKIVEYPFIFYHYKQRANTLSTQPIDIKWFKNTAQYISALEQYKNHFVDLKVYIEAEMKNIRRYYLTMFQHAHQITQTQVQKNPELNQWLI